MTNYIDNSFWAEIEEDYCPCKGTGWGEIGEEWQECPMHFHGQLHPESRLLLLDEPIRLREEERKSQLLWNIAKVKEEINEATAALKKHYANLRKWELELTNRTPTLKVEALRLPLEAK